MRLIGDRGEQLGIKAIDEAMRIARDQDLDLVEVAPQGKPPVCKIMDYSKFKYEQEIKAKEARKKQTTITIKEMKLRVKIDDHDFETKKKHVVRFLKQGDKVKITIMFRGREMAHQELGERLLMRLFEDVSELATIESMPKVDGRNMVMMLNPIKPKEKKEEKKIAEDEDS